MKYDLLALGHCGAGRASPFLVINDSTALTPSLYSKLRDPGHDVPEHGRLVYETNGAVCTYAYAVTSEGAENLIANLEDRDGPWDLLVADLCNNNEELWCGAVCAGGVPSSAVVSFLDFCTMIEGTSADFGYFAGRPMQC